MIVYLCFILVHLRELLTVFVYCRFLARHASAILALLSDGGDRDPEILEQVEYLLILILTYCGSVRHNDVLYFRSSHLGHA